MTVRFCVIIDTVYSPKRPVQTVDFGVRPNPLVCMLEVIWRPDLACTWPRHTGLYSVSQNLTSTYSASSFLPQSLVILRLIFTACTLTVDTCTVFLFFLVCGDCGHNFISKIFLIKKAVCMDAKL